VRLAVTLIVAALAALGGRALAPARAAQAEPAQDAQALATIAAKIQELRLENERLAAEIELRASTMTAARVPVEEIGDAEIGAALARWRSEHPAEVEKVATARSERAKQTSPDEIDLDSIPMSEIVQVLSREGLGNERRQALFQKLRDAGRIDEYVAAIEKLAEANPNDPDLQVALGHAYLQKLFDVGNTPEAGPWAIKSDAAFDRALALDDHNWAARFTKAVSLSNWPAFLGRGPEAIQHFEVLLEQQAAVPQREEFALTYLFLGNMQQASGDREKALATWKAGLERFPDRAELQRAVQLAETDSSGKRSSSR